MTGRIGASPPHGTQQPPPVGFFVRSQASGNRDSQGFGSPAPWSLVQVMEGSMGCVSSLCWPFALS